MGYTHYFKAFIKASDLFKELVPKIEAMGIKLCNGHGFNEPIITDTAIIFNGDNSQYLDCESFYITNDIRQEFCKTKRRPYDFAVCVALICLKFFMGNDIIITSDGEETDWQSALDFFNENMYTDIKLQQIISI